MTVHVTSVHGSVAELHELEIPTVIDRELWVMRPNDRAIVLGSGQKSTDLDGDAVAALGWQLVRRRSGGGAVQVDDHSLWLDLIVPRSDPEWTDDVSRSFWWLGDLLVEVLASYGIVADVHRGAYERTTASAMVCFAGFGPGEVVVGARKLVGLSQRRTRHAARFQIAILRRWRGAAWADLLVDRDPALHRQLATSAVGLDDLTSNAPSNDEIVERFAEGLSDSR